MSTRRSECCSCSRSSSEQRRQRVGKSCGLRVPSRLLLVSIDRRRSNEGRLSQSWTFVVADTQQMVPVPEAVETPQKTLEMPTVLGLVVCGSEYNVRFQYLGTTENWFSRSPGRLTETCDFPSRSVAQ